MRCTISRTLASPECLDISQAVNVDNLDMVYRYSILTGRVLFLPGQDSNPELATHVLQFVFISDSGFRFPVAQWPSGNCTPSDLYFLFWEGVLKMLEIGFQQVKHNLFSSIIVDKSIVND